MMPPSDLEAAAPPSRGEPARLLIADDHPLTRAGIRHALEVEQFEVCAEAGDADEAVDAAVRERPDLCLLDVYMPGGGIDAAERIADKVPEALVVMITAASDDDTVFAALRAGAVGFLFKDTDFIRLPEILLGVLKGEAALPRDVTARLLGEYRRRSRIRDLPKTVGPAVSLTSRETDVLELLLGGLGTAGIGHRLTLSPPTVRTHVAALLRKFGARDRAALLGLFEACTLPAGGRSSA